MAAAPTNDDDTKAERRTGTAGQAITRREATTDEETERLNPKQRDDR